MAVKDYIKQYLDRKADMEAYSQAGWFCKPSLEAFKFLIDENGFEKARIELNGPHIEILFRAASIYIRLDYEPMNLPEVIIEFYVPKSSKPFKRLSLAFFEPTLHEIRHYPVHGKMRAALESASSNVKEYKAQLDSIWRTYREDSEAEVIARLIELAQALRMLFK